MRKHIVLTPELNLRIKAFCAQNNIESESAFFRNAIDAFFDNSIRYEDMLLAQIKTLAGKTDKLEKTIELLFKLVQKTHQNMLGYHAEIPAEYKDAAQKNAEERSDRFFAYFRDTLKDEPAMFEQLLHGYFTGEGDEQV